MTREEAERYYPGAVDAVLGHEANTSSMWELFRAGGATPEHAPRIIRMAADRAVADGDWPEMVQMRPQLDHPDFLKYVKSKLGAM